MILPHLHRLLLAATRSLAIATERFSRRATAVQIAIGVIGLALGLVGWRMQWQQDHKGATLGSLDVFNIIMRTLQLVTLQFPREIELKTPWPLLFARVLLPIAAILATLNVVVGNLTRPLRLLLLRYMQGHIVVIGAEKLTEAALRALARRGRQIVVVAPSFDSARRDALEGLGMTCAERDPRLSGEFDELGIGAAAALLVAQEDDLANLDLALLAMRAHGETRRVQGGQGVLVLGALIDDDHLARELDAVVNRNARQNSVRFHRLCPDRDGIRLKLHRFAPVFHKSVLSRRSHVLMVGLEGRWQSVLFQLIHAAQDVPDATPLFTLVLNEAERASFAEWRASLAELDLIAEFAVLDSMPSVTPPGWVVPDLVVVMLPDAEGAATAMALLSPAHTLGTQASPLLIRQSREDCVISLLSATHEGTTLAVFGGVLRPETVERALDRKGDELPIALHASYLEFAPELGGGSAASLATWDGLDEDLRSANRASADHAPVLFAAIGRKADEPLSFTDAEIAVLARIEHRRWCADRVSRGWRYGAVHDGTRRLHQCLVPFDDLPNSEQQKDVEQVKTLIDVVATKIKRRD